MSNPIESQIKDKIASFVAELDLMVRKSTLESLQAVLSGTGAAPARRGRPAGSGRKSGRPRASGNVDEAAAKIEAHVKANDGQGISAIADATGLDLKVAKKAAIALLASGALKKSGQKRGTVYHVGSGKPARAEKAKKAGKRRGRKVGGKRKAAKAKRKPASRRGVVVPQRRRAARPAAAKRKGKPAGTKPTPAEPLSVVAPG